MPRAAHLAPGGFVYHVFNRANGRSKKRGHYSLHPYSVVTPFLSPVVTPFLSPMDLGAYASTTALAAQIAKDPGFASREIRYMKAIAPGVLVTMASVGPAGTWLTWTPGYTSITLLSSDDYYSIGDAALSGITFYAKVAKAANGDIIAQDISIGGTVSDIADFNWDFRGSAIAVALVQQAVKVQARYNRVGDAGHVFETKVQLNNSTGMGWDFTTNKKL